jgi:parallel beta-helix repeat protein
MITGVAIYGGFPAGGSTFENRDTNQYETILSGDIGTPEEPNDNCYHVFYHPDGSALEPNAILDGFTITAGNADEPYPSPHRAGGGMNNFDSSPTVTNCIFSGNLAYQSGGGMNNGAGCSPTVTDCTFTGNSADNGGGMSNAGFCNPTVTNCTFTGNSANEGGGMINTFGIPTVTDCTFTRNSAHYGGGGMNNNSDGNPIVTNCTFVGNSAGHNGGGMHNGSSSPTVTGCTFADNWGELGGGMSNLVDYPTVISCTFTNNSAGWGGGMFNWDNDSTVANCIFAGNTADFGGGMYNWDSSSPTVTGCTFTGNLAPNGNAIECDSNIESDPSVVHISNSILWDGGDEIFNNDGSTITITNSDIQGGWEGVGNIDADPCFVRSGYWNQNGTVTDPNDDFWVDGDYHLLSTSPCIDAGDNSAVTEATDLDQKPRIADGDGNGTAIVDMGAYEYRTAIYVDASAGGANNGTSWPDAFNYLQDALDDAVSGDQIWVAEGIYYPSELIDPCDPRTATFQMINGVAIYGGFPPGGDTFANRDPNMHETILSGDLSGNDNPSTPAEDLLNDPCRTDNCYHVFYHPEGTNLDTTAILDGFTVTAGNADESYPSPHNSGGGMYNENGSPTVSGCIFSGNSADWGGGGICNYWYSSPSVSNCTFVGNSAYDSGGGMCNYISSSPTVNGCTFIGNSAGFEGDWSFPGYGGGMANYFSSKPIVTGCKFTSNSSDFAGGMYNYDYSSPTVTNCTFTGNSAESDFFGGYGGGMNNEVSSPTVSGCTFGGNSADYEGGGMWNFESNPTLTNCIFWGNTASYGNEIYNEAGTPVISYCDISGCGGSGAGWDDDLGFDGSGNIDADPMFVDPNGPDDVIGTNDDNLRLLPDSDCIDAGDNSVVDPNITDLDGNPRIVNAIVDMGAYEHQSPMVLELDLSNTWMYQSLPNQTNSELTAMVSITDDPLNNTSYTYEWEFILPDDVTVAPTITAASGPADPCCTFAASSCNEPGGLSDSGQPLTVKVTVTGDDFDNIATAEAQFGISLLGDVNNDKKVDVADRSTINAFWRLGAAYFY